MIPTRQKVDMLWPASLMVLQAAGKTLTLPVAEVDGYQMISFLLISDQPVTLVIQESNSPAGPFVQTGSFSSTVDVASGLQAVNAKVNPVGSFMKALITNVGSAAQKTLQLGTGGYGGSGTGSSGGPVGSESLEQARAIGDTFTGGSVFWDNQNAAVFGKASGELNQDYLRIFSDKVNSLQVIDSTKDGAGTIRPISIQMGGVEMVRIATNGDVHIAGKLTVIGPIDPPSVSLSGGTALFFDSADGSTAPISAAGHARIRYVNPTGWEQSLNGGAYTAFGTSGPGIDTTAWHNTLDTFGAAKKIGTVDDFPFAIYSHSLNVGTFYDPRGSGTISPFSGQVFLSDLTTPGDQIYWLKNMDATPGADSSCELQFSSDVATLQIFTLNSNNPARSPGPGIFDMAPNEASIFAYNNPLNIVTGLDHPIQFILNGARMAYMDTTGFQPQVDASIALTTLGTAALRWNSVHAFYGILDALTVGTFGTTATAEGEIQAGISGGWRWFVRDDGSNIINEFSGMAGRDTYIPLIGKGGAGTAHSLTLQFINSDVKTTYLTFPESGYVKDAVAEAGFFSIVGYTGIGVRVNINGTDNSGWSIDSSGKMTIYAAEIGIYGHATVAQQTVTGSRGGNAALADLLTKLANTGLIVDGTS